MAFAFVVDSVGFDSKIEDLRVIQIGHHHLLDFGGVGFAVDFLPVGYLMLKVRTESQISQDLVQIALVR